jgi:hypothetical protein
VKRILPVLAVLCALTLIVVVSVRHQAPNVSHTNPVQSANDSTTGSAVLLLVFSALGLIVYFIPSLVARGRNRAAAIFILNLFLGWTVLGWVGALVWAVAEKKIDE